MRRGVDGGNGYLHANAVCLLMHGSVPSRVNN